MKPSYKGRSKVYFDVPDGPRLFYEIHGDGPPVVLIAGTGCDHLWWAPQIEFFSRRYSVVACDMRGAGRSTIYEDCAKYTSARMAEDVACLLDELSLGPAHVVGHSLGSCIAQQLALLRPDLVRSVQMHATWAHADEWLRRAFVGTMAYLTERGDVHSAWKTVGMWIFSPRYLEERSPARVAEIVAAEFINNPHLNAANGLLGHLHADGEHDTRSALRDVIPPVLVTAGELDVCIPPRYGAFVRDEVPNVRWHLFKGEHAAHAYNIEMAEEFNHVSLGFMLDHDSPQKESRSANVRAGVGSL